MVNRPRDKEFRDALETLYSSAIDAEKKGFLRHLVASYLTVHLFQVVSTRMQNILLDRFVIQVRFRLGSNKKFGRGCTTDCLETELRGKKTVIKMTVPVVDGDVDPIILAKLSWATDLWLHKKLRFRSYPSLNGERAYRYNNTTIPSSNCSEPWFDDDFGQALYERFQDVANLMKEEME